MTRLRAIMMSADTELVELLIGLIYMAWGVCYIVFFNLFTRYPEVFRALKQIAPAWVWGCTLILVGFGYWHANALGTCYYRRIACQVGVSTGVFLGVVLLLGGVPHTSAVIALLLATVSGLVYQRMRICKGTEEGLWVEYRDGNHRGGGGGGESHHLQTAGER